MAMTTPSTGAVPPSANVSGWQAGPAWLEATTALAKHGQSPDVRLGLYGYAVLVVLGPAGRCLRGKRSIGRARSLV